MIPPLCHCEAGKVSRSNLGGVKIQKAKVKNQNDKSKRKNFRKKRVYCFSIVKEGIPSCLAKSISPER